MSDFHLIRQHVSNNEIRRISEMSEEDRPAYRVQHVGPRSVANIELLATVIGGDHAMVAAQDLMDYLLGDLMSLPKIDCWELQQLQGIGKTTAARLVAAIELGRRIIHHNRESNGKITSPADCANLLMGTLSHLDQEELWVVVVNTRNEVISKQAIYRGSLNTSVVRIAELIRPVIIHNGAAFLVAHNHPSGDPAPSPEDVQVTRQIRKAGDLFDMQLLDHIIIGHQRYASLKERGLGFDD